MAKELTVLMVAKELRVLRELKEFKELREVKELKAKALAASMALKTPMAPKTPMPPMSAGRKVFKNVKNVGGCVGGLKKLAKFAGGMVSPLRRCSICRLCSSTDRIEVS